MWIYIVIGVVIVAFIVWLATKKGNGSGSDDMTVPPAEQPPSTPPTNPMV